MSTIFEPQEFSVLDVENLRLHYARTCRAWLDRFEAAADRVAEMYDADFVRAWRLYLSGSVAAFTHREPPALPGGVCAGHVERGTDDPRARVSTKLARKIHRCPAADANPLAVAGRTPESRFDSAQR